VTALLVRIVEGDAAKAQSSGVGVVLLVISDWLEQRALHQVAFVVWNVVVCAFIGFACDTSHWESQVKGRVLKPVGLDK